MPLIDVMVCTTCELRCVGCTNYIGGLNKLDLYPVADVERDVHAAATVLHADVAVILGGEPLQHPDLLELMDVVKESGIADRVRVLTNGIRLHKMTDLFWGQLEDLKISVYPDGVTPESNVELARAKQAEHGFELSFYDVASDPFRAVLTPAPRGDEDAQRTYDACWYRSNTRKIEQGHLYRCCTSATISKNLLGLPPDHDGIALDGITVETLEAFLGRGEFMESCRRCHGNMGPRIHWSEQRDRVKWLDVSMVAA